MKYLFLFSIKPVQEFIQQARKTQDLFAGSNILAGLCKAALNEFAKDGTPIYPDTSYQRAESLPNRFLGIIERENSEKVKKIGDEIELKVKAKFKSICRNAIANTGILQADLPNGFDEQINTHLTINWLALPIDNSGYKDAYAKIEQGLGIMKQIHEVNDFIYQQSLDKDKNIRKEQRRGLGELGRKCSIDGVRNVKFYRLSASDKRRGVSKTVSNKLFVKKEEVCLVPYEVPLRFLQEGEGLSAVSFVKRCHEPAEVGNGFPSTAGITLQAIKDKWANEPEISPIYFKLIEKFSEVFKGREYDDQLFFEENLNASYFETHGYRNQIKHLVELRTCLKKLEIETKKWSQERYIRGFEMPRYYAILMFDGDSMGKWLSGFKFKQDSLEDNPELLLAFHKSLSRRLSIFANCVYSYLKPPMGRAVYAGGDDFLGFVNLEKLWQVLEHIRSVFDDLVANPLCEIGDYKNGRFGNYLKQGAGLSFSAGVVIAPYKMPLNVALSKVREVEKSAKKAIFSPLPAKPPSKDALGIAVLKKSGEPLECYWPWTIEGHNTAFQISEIIIKLRNRFSSNFIRQAYREFSLIIDPNLEGYARVERRILLVELERLLIRSYIDDPELTAQENRTKRKIEVEELIDILAKFVLHNNYYKDFFQLLFVCDFIQRKTNGY